MKMLQMSIRKDFLEPDYYYHIFNRGINSSPIFKEEKNYDYFLKKFSEYILEIADLYAFCLMPNHYHFVIKIKSEEELYNFSEANNLLYEQVKEGVHSPKQIASKQWSRFIGSYTLGYNKVYRRHGALLETPFKRKRILNDMYLKNLIQYVHLNPEGINQDFRTYRYSSYSTFLGNHNTVLKREEVFDLFDNKENFIHCHNRKSNFDVEYDF